MTAELNNQDPTRNARHLFTDLLQRADDPTWWRVPLNKAPAQGAYAMHELIPAGSGAGRVVTVNLRGLADSARGADWRASLIAVSDTGVERYTPLWSTGSSSITLAANENKLYLSVAGTPDVFHYGGHDESAYRFRSHPSRSRFHYEVQVTGATPRERNNGSTTSGFVTHSNGGGLKASTASVAATAYVGPNARVEDYAVVQDTARIEDNAVVSGHAWVHGSAIVRNFARVRDWAIIDSGTISGNARVLEHATVAANMQDTAVAKGSAIHQTGGVLSGNAIVDGDYMFNKSLTGGVTFGHWPWVGVPDNFTTATPAGLYAAYNFRTTHDSRALDQYGVIDAFTIGSPAWTANDGERRGFLTFNGSNQFISLDRSVADSQAFTFAAWVKPTGGAANQAVLWLGATTTRRLSLTPSDASGQAKFSIVNGGAEQSLTATALPVGVWSHIAVTLNGTTGVLYVNGTAAASGSITIRPDQLLAANTTTGIQHNYLARAEGSAMPMLQGSLDDAQFYSSALNAAQITTLATPPAPVGDLMFSDSFTSESYDSGSFNNNLATDQQGYNAPTTYTVFTGGQGWQAQHGNGGTMLLVGDGGYHSRASLNEDFALLANEFEQPLAFQMDAWVDTGSDTCWASVVLGSSQNINADSSGAKFAIRPLKNGALQVWVNGSQMTSASRSGNTFRIVLSDTAGTGSAFNGNGSKAALYNGTTLVGTYTLPQLVPGDGYLTCGAQPDNGYMLVRIDNLSISKITPPPSTLSWQGDTDTDFNTAANYLENGWAEWTHYIFDSRAVSGTLNVDAYTGWGNLSLNSGLTTDIVIQSSNPSAYPIIMAPGLYAGGTITIAASSRNLTINTDYLAINAQVWNVGAERTLTLNGNFSNWNGVAASLEKQGSGTAILSGNNTYTGGTTITGGTIIAGAGGLGKGAVTLASGATLATTSTSSTGLAALYYNNTVSQANIASLPALLAHFGANNPAPALVQTATSMNFAGDGSGFPAPYNSGATGFEAFYSGKVNIATAGTYTFNTSSDDGSMLFIDGVAVVANNFDQPVTTRSGAISLTAGMHDIVIAFNQGGGGYGMDAQMSGPGNTTMVDINTGNANITPDLVVGSLAGAGNVALTTGNLITGIDNSSTNLSGVISGIGGVTKFGSGVQTLTGTNTYTGATTISAGTLQLGDGGTTGSLSTSSTITNNGNLIINRSNAVTQGTDFSASAIVGSGSLTQAGTGTTTLIATNTYIGNTTVLAGTLRLGNGTSSTNLADNANVIVATEAMLDLDYSGTDQIRALWVDGLQMPPGIYSSTTGFITGPGTLTVTNGSASASYAAWSGRGIHDLTGGPSDDDDGDTIANVLEYVLGGNPLATSTGILPTANTSAGNLIFTFRRIQSTTADTTQVFQYGTNLSGWTDVPVVAGGIIAIQPDTPQAGTDTVIINVPAITSPQVFGRLKVTIQAP
jgi:autotransporter-associated beta strand protein